MKICPQCQKEYLDETLVYCLEDGAELEVRKKQSKIATENFSVNQQSVETMFFEERAKIPDTIEVARTANASIRQNAAHEPATFKEKTIEKGYRALETGTLALALALNWWQWLYLDRRNYGSIGDFLLSSQFLIWFLLFAAGTTCGLLSLKLSRRKDLSYAGLIILAVNFILLLVPKK